MISRRGRSGGSRKRVPAGIYAIVDSNLLKGEKIFKVAEAALAAGASIIQLRDKSSDVSGIIKRANNLKRLARKYRAPFIMNDRLDVALAVGADGLHIGQGDIDISLAKKLMKRDSLIGVSAKNLREAIRAKRDGADYLGVGPVFATPIKRGIRPKGLRLPLDIKRLKIPFFAIGGIGCKNIRKLAEKGFKNVAVIRAICKSKDPYLTVKNLKAWSSIK